MKMSDAITQFVTDINVKALPNWLLMFQVECTDTDNSISLRKKLIAAMNKVET